MSPEEWSIARATGIPHLIVPGAGHAVTLERDAPGLQSAMGAWLTANRL